MSESIIRLENISVALGGEQILKNLNLNIGDKEFVTLLGPSGCGKTTTLRIIGGFQRQDSGNVFFANEIINDLPPYKRNVNTVFQKYALFPHLTVFGNIAYGLRMQKVPKDERKTREQKIKKRVDEMLELVNLRGFEDRDISSLSGGQQQRVAIARALVNKPHVLLLDEPLGALDLKLRKEMQIELKNIQIKTGITFIYVTHDQEEALTMSDTVVVMKGGEIQQIGTPQDIYNEPKNAFVADFIGESNILPGVMLEDYRVEICGRLFECVDKGFAENEKVGIVVRPEDIEIKPENEGFLRGVVKSCVFKGVHYEMTIEQINYPYTWLVHSTDAADIGDTVGMCFYPNDIHVMKGEDIDYSVFSAVPEEETEE